MLLNLLFHYGVKLGQGGYKYIGLFVKSICALSMVMISAAKMVSFDSLSTVELYMDGNVSKC